MSGLPTCGAKRTFKFPFPLLVQTLTKEAFACRTADKINKTEKASKLIFTVFVFFIIYQPNVNPWTRRWGVTLIMELWVTLIGHGVFKPVISGQLFVSSPGTGSVRQLTS